MGSPSILTTEFIQNSEQPHSAMSSRSLVRSASASSAADGGGTLVSHLKRSLEQAQNELNQQIFLNSELKVYKSKYEDLSNDYNTLASSYESLESEKKFSDIEITNLRKETEELSSQLFSEANNMVSLARKEAFAFKKTNDVLKNELSEKDNLIHILKSQLTDLKNMLQDQPEAIPNNNNIEITFYPDENLNGENFDFANEGKPEGSEALDTDTSGDLKKISLRNHSTGNFSVNNTGKAPHLHQNNSYNIANFIYAPTVQAIRYDIKSYELFVHFGERFYREFKAGLHTSNTSKSSYLEIKEQKFYKKLLNDDIEPALRLDEAPGVAWLSKKNLINSMLIGKVSIEPISSVNESYKTDIVLSSLSELNVASGPKVNSTQPASEPPVAFEDPCSLCGEFRNDTLDHTRLYVLKVIGTRTIKKKNPNATSGQSQNSFSKFVSNNNSKDTISITQEYIASQYPLCSYCLHRVRSVCELFAFLRGIKAGIWKFDTKVNCQKNWIECVRIRTKIFFSRIGITESTHNLVNNNSFTFNANQINGIDIDNHNNLDVLSDRNSGYFSNHGTRMSSPVMTNFGTFSAASINANTSSGNAADPESESSSPVRNSGLFSNRNSIIGSFWGANSTNSPSSSTTNTPDTLMQILAQAPAPPARKKENVLSVYNESSSPFNSDKLEGKIDEAMSASVDDDILAGREGLAGNGDSGANQAERAVSLASAKEKLEESKRELDGTEEEPTGAKEEVPVQVTGTPKTESTEQRGN